MKALLLIVVLVIVGGIWYANSGWYAAYVQRANIQVARSKSLDVSYYTEKATTFDYRTGVLDGYAVDTPISLEGKVLQVSSDQGVDFVQLDTRKREADGRYFGDPVVVFWDNPQVLPDDVVRIYARYQGSRQYKSVLGSVQKLPTVIMDHFEVAEERK